LRTGSGVLGATGDMPPLGVFALMALHAQYLAVEQAAVGAVAAVVEFEISTGAATLAAVSGPQQSLLFYGGVEFGAADHLSFRAERLVCARVNAAPRIHPLCSIGRILDRS
jgi:hypothetical protein